MPHVEGAGVALHYRSRGAGPAVVVVHGMGSDASAWAGVLDELAKKMAEFAESMQAQQGLVWADNAIKLAVEMTVAAINRVNIQGTIDQQAEQIRSVMAIVFPDAVALVREARQGLQ